MNEFFSVFLIEMIEEQQAQVQKYHLNRIFNVVFPYFAFSLSFFLSCLK